MATGYLVEGCLCCGASPLPCCCDTQLNLQATLESVNDPPTDCNVDGQTTTVYKWDDPDETLGLTLSDCRTSYSTGQTGNCDCWISDWEQLGVCSGSEFTYMKVIVACVAKGSDPISKYRCTVQFLVGDPASATRFCTVDTSDLAPNAGASSCEPFELQFGPYSVTNTGDGGCDCCVDDFYIYIVDAP